MNRRTIAALAAALAVGGCRPSDAALAGDAGPVPDPVVVPARYRFVTGALSSRRVSSTTGYRDLVDHHLATNELAALEVPGSAEVYRVDVYIPEFARTTSDHFPVISHYALGASRGGPQPAPRPRPHTFRPPAP